jgi:acetyltransferase
MLKGLALSASAQRLRRERRLVQCMRRQDEPPVLGAQLPPGLARARDYSLQRQKHRGTVPSFSDIDREKAKKIIETAAEGWLQPTEVYSLLESYGIKTLAPRFAAKLEEALVAAQSIGYPVALKVDSATIVHKTEVGGVILDIASPEELKQAYSRMMEKLATAGRSAEVRGVTVQKMAGEGIELIAGVTHDATFGPLILFGLGGIYTELFKDSVVRIQPLTDTDVKEMVHSVKAYKLLEGFRGAPPADITAIEELLLRLSALAEDLPRVKELDLNPVRAFAAGEGYAVVDARVLLS